MFCSSCNYNLQSLPAAPSPVCPECGHPFDPADPKSFLASPSSPALPIARRIATALIILVLCGFVAMIGSIIYAARRAMLAEERLQTTRLVCELIAEHVEASPTHAWPTSWADLEKLPARQSIHSWPRDAAVVRALVKVDFSLTTAQVLKQTPQTCTAITLPPGSDFSGSPQLEFAPFFDRLRAAANSATPP